MYYNVRALDGIENRERKPSNDTPSEAGINHPIHFRVFKNRHDGRLHTIEKVKAQPSTLPFLPGKGQFQVVLGSGGVAQFHLYLSRNSSCTVFQS